MTDHAAEPDEQTSEDQTSEDQKSKWADLAPGAEGYQEPPDPEAADDAAAPGSLGGDNGGG